MTTNMDFSFGLDGWGIDFTYDGFVDDTTYIINIQPDTKWGGSRIKFGPVEIVAEGLNCHVEHWHSLVDSWQPLDPEKIVKRILGENSKRPTTNGYRFTGEFKPHGKGFICKWTQTKDGQINER